MPFVTYDRTDDNAMRFVSFWGTTLVRFEGPDGRAVWGADTVRESEGETPQEAADRIGRRCKALWARRAPTALLRGAVETDDRAQQEARRYRCYFAECRARCTAELAQIAVDEMCHRKWSDGLVKKEALAWI